MFKALKPALGTRKHGFPFHHTSHASTHHSSLSSHSH
jgi:hypothetical protein